MARTVTRKERAPTGQSDVARTVARTDGRIRRGAQQARTDIQSGRGAQRARTRELLFLWRREQSWEGRGNSKKIDADNNL